MHRFRVWLLWDGHKTLLRKILAVDLFQAVQWAEREYGPLTEQVSCHLSVEWDTIPQAA